MMKYTSLIALILVIGLNSCQEGTDPVIQSSDFEIQAEKTFVNRVIQFKPSTEAAYAYYWDFGNGVTSNEQYPSNSIFETPGVYQVSLTTTSLNKIKSTTTKEVAVGGYVIQRMRVLPKEKFLGENLKIEVDQQKLGQFALIDELEFSEPNATEGLPFELVLNKQIIFSNTVFSEGFPLFKIYDLQSGEQLANNNGFGNRWNTDEDGDSGEILVNTYSNSKADFEVYFTYEIED